MSPQTCACYHVFNHDIALAPAPAAWPCPGTWAYWDF